MAKQKFIDMKINGVEQTNGNGKGKQLAIAQSSASQNPNEDSSLELTTDQEAAVEDFIRLYMKSFEITTSEDNYAVNEAIDKETYQKTKWQRMLYRKISSKRHLLINLHSVDQKTLVERIIEIAKVLFGLHMVEHPQVKSKGTWRKLISGQRKKAVMACFRMAPLHSIPHHRAINLFIKAYKMKWLEIEEENDKDEKHEETGNSEKNRKLKSTRMRKWRTSSKRRTKKKRRSTLSRQKRRRRSKQELSRSK
jgi:hypothetical protein